MNIREELAEYLGNNYESHKLHFSNTKLEQMLDKYGGDWSKFEQDKESLYYYVWRDWEEWWLPHLTFARENIPPGASVLDYQAGVGQFGLHLVDHYGMSVGFAEGKNKPGDFLRWRLKQRGVKEKVQLLDDAAPQDVVMAFGVAGRYGDELEFINHLSSFGDLLIFDLDSRQSDVPQLESIVNHRIVNGCVNLIAIRSK
jgi:hypothetical protein